MLCLRYDALLFTETWLRENEAPSKFHSYGYARMNRKQKRDGGILIYLIACILFTDVQEPSVVHEDVECLVVRTEK